MTFAATLRAELAAAPVTVAEYMARCNAHYYATRDPFGAAGDFVTAPEISQMFGELVGAWLADTWRRAGSPPAARLVELGPGRGTLMHDMLRIIAAAHWEPQVFLVETSPVLRAAQQARIPRATSVAALDDVPDDAPLFVVANEFFDALPVRQLVRTGAGWAERLVAANDDGFYPVLGRRDATPLIPPALVGAPPGSVVELSPASTAIAAEIGARLRRHGGAALIVDYGYAGPATGDTLQAVRAHARADPFTDPGEADLTCHVDFSALAAASRLPAWGPTAQGDWLNQLGIALRARTLAANAPHDRAAGVAADVERLTGAGAMGALFKVLALTPDAGTMPPGFA